MEYRDRNRYRYRKRKDGGTGHWRVAGHNPRPFACASEVGPDPDFDSDCEESRRQRFCQHAAPRRPFVLGATLKKGDDPREPGDAPAAVTRFGFTPRCRPLVDQVMELATDRASELARKVDGISGSKSLSLSGSKRWRDWQLVRGWPQAFIHSRKRARFRSYRCWLHVPAYCTAAMRRPGMARR